MEITDPGSFINTPTFLGLSLSNVGSVLNVNVAEVQGYLTPSGSMDTIPPVVTVSSPNGGESYNAAQASHLFLESPFHRESAICGTCHDVSNPVFLMGSSSAEYVLDAFDAPHPDGNLRNMFPVERTYSEWLVSAYADTGVYAPQFAGDKPNGRVSTCQDCHMRDVTGKGCNEPGAPTRTDLPLHDLTEGNYFIPDILPEFFGGEVDTARLNAGKQRAVSILQLAASMSLSTGQISLNPTVTVTITNETGHRLPPVIPKEGESGSISRRMMQGW
ncbi:MAG: hypothetical protein GTO51_03350 [Candidatus Latescibacteria bacterium]|nr:hypothetical protein [Candidatus Latescibacterota bacterium]NIM20874.1 hypothetical protein [Candidatus Latescibacterota bacterium]NIM65009.1 hypothetical protein [Candidatus Latescibacterota bacterium]NIO01524.1 hypothetical protein [Candidatus Latescibacterota bacterium]NIO28041.1 hypothetical protein [Candidatus Latescibacterota bacterium]